LVQRIRGAAPRESLREALASGDFSRIVPADIRETLTVQERRRLLRIHPHLALGEYLPELEGADLPEGEDEIARLYLASGIGDPISIRARRKETAIELRAVDKFGDRLSVKPASIAKPLTNLELLEAVKSLEWHAARSRPRVSDARVRSGE
jgi:hypothetical protein